MTGMPMWVAFDRGGAPLVSSGPSSNFAWFRSRLDNSADPADSGVDSLNLAPPTNTKRVKIAGTWSCTNSRSGSSSTSGLLSINSPGANVTHTDDLVFTAPPGTSGTGATTTGSFEAEFTLGTPASNNWPGTIPQIGTAQGDAPSDFGVRLEANLAASGSVGDPASIALTVNVTVLEIELEDGTLYTFADLSASLTTWLRVQAAKQESFGTAVEPVFGLPVVFDYQDGTVEQLAVWDAGAWTPAEIVEVAADYATFTLRGALFFELLPVLLGAGFGEMAPSGVGPYTYSGSAGPDAVGAPAPYTVRLGGNEGSVGSLVQIQDAYCHSLTLSFNLNDKVVKFESQWFGRQVDDNDGAGYAPLAVPLPTNLAMANGLLSVIGIQDAGASGGAFDALDEFECSVIEWQLQIDTGLRPAWAGDQNGLTYCGVRHEEPRATWQPHVRTTAENYAVTLTKAQARTYQEVQLGLYGIDREFVLRLTGRWLGRLNAHDRSRGEVVMQPMFQVATPHSQTTSPHWMSWTLETGWEHE